ncbi:MAG: tRNA (adenosine(37)-N6)-threonylcarbamoyltransferase complex ATPase subunit type 1 TsaE [Candidatus Zambryskibacteria bacterium]|nr:tRNA (adenosine(37)-N6)-threonylcarbamoyltransferase complex ATPase subunit type 1 TsaE [Candidatus Zambryskibacteria bacterium]
MDHETRFGKSTTFDYPAAKVDADNEAGTSVPAFMYNTIMNLLPHALVESLAPGPQAAVVALQGDLGAGKTTFTQKVGKILGITENMHSPTFVIEKIYEIDFKGFKKFIHIDAYRIEKESELLHLGWEELVKNPENLIFIEWPENVPGLIPNNAIKVSFKHVDEDTREISI